MVSACWWVAVACIGTAVQPDAHPVHAARIEIISGTNGDVAATVRVYRQDFLPHEQVATATFYLASALIVTDARGARVSLHVDSLLSEGDRLRIVLHGKATSALSGGRLAVTLLQEKFPDQVNVASVQVAGRTRQLVFLRGDASQVLP
jgi:hypothetical protein